MHFKKRVIAVAAVAVMAAALLYGGTLKLQTRQEEEGRLPWFSKKETIYFWYTDEALSNYINSAAVSFGEREGVRVIPVLTSGNEYLEALNQASLYSSQLPDAYLISHDSLEKAYLAGLAGEVQDTSGILNEENFPEAALSAVSYEGKTVAYPLSFETSALVYNETYLTEWAEQTARNAILNPDSEGAEAEADTAPVTESEGEADPELLAQKTAEYFGQAIPSTVDEILNIADTFDAPEGVEGVFSWDVSDIFYNYWIVGNYMIVGGDAGDDKRQMDIANNETIQCLEVYKALNQFFFIESDTVAYESVLQDFMDGKMVFTIATTDAVEKLKAAKESGEMDFEYGFATMPEVSSELKSRSMSVTGAVAINGYSTHKELANRFAAYLTGEYADVMYEMTGRPAANLEADTDNGALQIFKMEYADSVPLPKMMETGNFWLQLERLFARVWNGADVTTLVQELSDQIVSQVNIQNLE